MQKLRYAFLAVAGVFGVLVAARAIAGPLSFPVSIRTPINIESFCGLCLLAALLVPVEEKPLCRATHTGREWIWGLALILLIVAGFWRSINVHFLADDFVLVTRANAFGLGKVREVLTTAEASAFFRPLIHLTMAVTARWAHFDPALWRANAVALHAVNSLLVFALALRLQLSRVGAVFAGALFAIHGCLPESVVWIAGWFGTLSTFFVLVGLILFVESLNSVGRGARVVWTIASLCAMILALLSKETAYAFALIAALLVWDGRVPLRRAAPSLAAFFLGSGIVFAYRWRLLGGIGGYVDLNSGGALLMKLSPVAVFRSLFLRLWAVLFFPINWSREPSVWLGVMTAVYIAALMVLAFARRKGPSLLVPAGFVILAALPPLEQLLIGPDLQKSRELYLPLVGFCLLLARASGRLETHARWLVPCILVAFNFVALQHNITIWQKVGAIAQRGCAAASNCSRNERISVRDLPGSLDGVYFLGVGFSECVALASHSGPVATRTNSDSAGNAGWDAAARELRCDVNR